MIDDYLKTLGNFFYKYIHRGLAQVKAESERTISLGGVDELKNRYATYSSQYFGGATASIGTDSHLVRDGSIEDDGIQQIVDGTSRLMSPVRNRLDSPVTKSALRNTSSSLAPHPATQLTNSQLQGSGQSRIGDSTIVSLKERLAKLRQNP